MKKIINLLIILSLTSIAQAQITLGAGASLQKTFGVKSPYYGGHVLVEKATDEYQSFFAKVSFYGNQFTKNSLVYAEATDFNTTPSVLELNSRYSFNYISLDFGKRFYFLNGFDYGFAPYGGASVSGYFNQIKMKTDPFDQTKYLIAGSAETKGNIFTFSFGLNGGVKYDFHWGTLYAEAALSYAILAVPSNDLARNGYYELGGPLLFNFGVGYKKTLYFR